MYTIVLAAALTAGNAAPGADIYDDIRDIKREVKQLRQNQTQIELEGLKLIIAGLRERITDEKLDELRRDIRDLKYEDAVLGVVPGAAPGVAPRSIAVPMPGASGTLMPVIGRSVITLKVPAGATFFVNDQAIPLTSTTPSFITPPLEPGRDYVYDFRITAAEDGKTITRIKRVTVRAGGVVRVNYEDMEVR